MTKPWIELYFLGLFALYLLLGFYGTLWISDEFDTERSLFYSFFAIPLAIYFLTRRWLDIDWRNRRPASYYGCILLLLLSFAWGQFLWLNAISQTGPALVNITFNEGVYALTHQRGGFHWLYKPRW